eukprot:GHRR01010243.1.p1 GENE.GHRR01010243.1~~GHRR01010243.1.p1  ORF type:complete len:117 (+),score=22.50 GHRR01010243.1:182-532(+)
MTSSVAAAAQQAFGDCVDYAVFTASLDVLAASYNAQPAELQALVRILDDRETAIKNGMTINQQRYEVQRFHPPLAYGRTMGCASEQSVGAALCRVEPGINGQPCFAVITYRYSAEC